MSINSPTFFLSLKLFITYSILYIVYCTLYYRYYTLRVCTRHGAMLQHQRSNRCRALCTHTHTQSRYYARPRSMISFVSFRFVSRALSKLAQGGEHEQSQSPLELKAKFYLQSERDATAAQPRRAAPRCTSAFECQ